MSAKFSHETKRERESEHSSMYITIFILHPSVGNRAADRKKKKKKGKKRKERRSRRAARLLNMNGFIYMQMSPQPHADDRE